MRKMTNKTAVYPQWLNNRDIVLSYRQISTPYTVTAAPTSSPSDETDRTGPQSSTPQYPYTSLPKT